MCRKTKQENSTLFTGRDGDVAVREDGYGELYFVELSTQLAWWHVEIDWVGLTIGECVDKDERSFIDNLFYGWEWLKSIVSRKNFTVIKEKTK